MSFALYVIGFVILVASLAWAATTAGIPQLYIAIGSVILLGIGIFTAVATTRAKDSPT